MQLDWASIDKELWSHHLLCLHLDLIVKLVGPTPIFMYQTGLAVCVSPQKNLAGPAANPQYLDKTLPFLDLKSAIPRQGYGYFGGLLS